MSRNSSKHQPVKKSYKRIGRPGKSYSSKPKKVLGALTEMVHVRGVIPRYRHQRTDPKNRRRI